MEEEFNVSIVDSEGKVILNDTMTSLSNGFIDLWLPRDQTFHVTIEHGEHIVESEISTFEGDHTCITTMQFM
ncbi:hypothetical protein JCM9140_3560 [Halalkalibacter wakoensis JCM 9140]|uniref:Uncharacterized protein n=1 Tax=Halalkalibacter wakoensis JCM 9140 TaxID=1236970 RepID=W4Q7U2_9BACI|nr:hypothetical protein JCM9140_3560 [Halalkalibacter wakoensis JCM 9140]